MTNVAVNWMRGRVAEGSGLLSRLTRRRDAGSNPAASVGPRSYWISAADDLSDSPCHPSPCEGAKPVVRSTRSGRRLRPEKAAT